MSASREDRNLVQVVIGLGILAVGVLFTLDNVGVLEASDYLRYWPLALVAVGVAQIVQARSWSSYVGAVMWMVAGLWFLGRNVGLIRVGVGDLWPVILAGAGALLVFRGWRGYDARRPGGTAPPAGGYEPDDDGWFTPVATPPVAPPPPVPMPPPAPPPQVPTVPLRTAPEARPRPTGGVSSGPDTEWRQPATPGERVVNAFAIMGGFTRRLNTQDFRGGTAVAVMGGVKLDLRNASIAQGEAVVDLLAFWGGVEIRIPEDWIVVPQVFPFMGGFDDRTGPKPAGSRKRLVLRGLAFMGGVEVKH